MKTKLKKRWWESPEFHLRTRNIAITSGEVHWFQYFFNIRCHDSDRNWRDPDKEDRSAFFLACEHHQTEIIKTLYETPGIDLDLPRRDGLTPFGALCKKRDPDWNTFVTLLEDPRIDINAADLYNRTPIIYLACTLHLPIYLKRALASGKQIDIPFSSGFLPTKALLHTHSNLLLERYERDALQTKHELRAELRLPSLNALLFGTIVFICDGLLRIKEEQLGPAARFFAIAKRLPMDLQDLLANRCYRKKKDFTLQKEREEAFKNLAVASFSSK